MGEPSPRGEAEDAEHRIRRTPDLQVVTRGARVRYACEWTAPGRPPEVAGDGYWGPRDGVRWFKYGHQPPQGFLQRQIEKGPLTEVWDLIWNDEPGQYTVFAEIRSRLARPDAPPTYRTRTQQVGDTGAMLADWLDRLVRRGQGPSCDDAEREIARHRTLLDDIARRLPPQDPARHRQVVETWAELATRLRALLAPSDGKRRIPVRGIHLETATQAQRPLFLFLADLGEVSRHAGRAGATSRKRWTLVDWTDPSDPRFRGSYDGEGETAAEAIAACFSNWEWSNRYPAGHVAFDVPAALRAVVGGAVQRRNETDGRSLVDEVVGALEWIAVGTMLIAGFCFIFVAVPTAASLAMATSMLASTAGAVFSVAQRWREGLFDWRADAIDGLTVAGNLVGAGAWARGARVRLRGAGGQTVDHVFLGARIGTDAAQGILVVASRAGDVDTLMKDPALPPDERARKLLALFAELIAVGLMTAVSFRASAREAGVLNKKPDHLAGDPRATVPEQRLDDLTHPDRVVDTTAPPVAEGHAKTVNQETTVHAGVTPAQPRRRLEAHETALAKAYPENGHAWRSYEISKRDIYFMDRDGFVFEAHCHNGTLSMTVITVFDPRTMPTVAPHFRYATSELRSKVLRAKTLFPLMYDHFERVGNRVQRLKGVWAWMNYRDARAKFDELIKAGMGKKEAAAIAVLHARTYLKYHRVQGFDRVVSATHQAGAEAFKFEIERSAP